MANLKKIQGGQPPQMNGNDREQGGMGPDRHREVKQKSTSSGAWKEFNWDSRRR